MDEASPSQSEGQPEPVYKTTAKPFDALDWKFYQFMRDNEEELADHYMGGLPGSAPEDDPVSSVGAECEREVPVHAFLRKPYRMASTDDHQLDELPPVPRQLALQAAERSANPELASGELYQCAAARPAVGWT
jgi:hypothetical protein